MQSHQNRAHLGVGFHSDDSSVGSEKPSEHSEQNSLSLHTNQDFIDSHVPRYFGVKSTQYQKSIIRGRHPVSIPKDSELWYYSKMSAERKDKILRGNRFWDVINESNANKHAEKIMHYTKRQHHLHKQMKNAAKKEKKSEDLEDDDSEAADRHLLKGSLQSQLKAAMAAHSEVDMKIDFNKKGVINYGMTCIIMNYANEVLYVDKYNELRAKPMSQVQPTDRIKFKMIDLLSPSNPRAIHFGQNCWLQCLDLSENADNSFQAGSVLTSKLFGPPELESVNFADSYRKLGADEHAGHNGLQGKADSKALALLDDKDGQRKRPTTGSAGKDGHGSDDDDDKTHNSQSSQEELDGD
eukprot:gene44172-54003_t